MVVHLDCGGRVCSAREAAASQGSCGLVECDVSGIHFYRLQQYETYQWHLQYEEMVSIHWDST